MRGCETYFLTGTDEHGDKIVQAAKDSQMTPKAYVDHISQLFQNMWPELNISNDAFVRTTDPSHMAVVENVSKSMTRATSISAGRSDEIECSRAISLFDVQRWTFDVRCLRPLEQARAEINLGSWARINTQSWAGINPAATKRWVLGRINLAPTTHAVTSCMVGAGFTPARTTDAV